MSSQGNASSSSASIGPSLSIKGELTGNENLTIDGRVEGKIDLPGQEVMIGSHGNVRAEIHARSILVEGKVQGDLYGEESIVIKGSGSVEGNLYSPKVGLDNGCAFKGSVDMNPIKRKVEGPVTPKGSSGPKNQENRNRSHRAMGKQ